MVYITKINNRTNEVRCTDKIINKVFQGLPSEDGRSWRVQLVFKGDKYGRDNCLTHDTNEPMVEFYDLSYPETFGEDGQFVSRYSLSTILFERNCFYRQDIINAKERNPKYGIDLQGNVDGWEMSGDCLTEVLDQIKILYIKNQLAPSYSEENLGFANTN